MSQTKMIEMLPVPLTAAEHHARSLELAELLTEIEAEDVAEVERKKAARDEQAKREVRAKALTRVVRDQREERPVETFETQNCVTWQIEVWRADTGERIRSRPMTAPERADAAQGRLAFVVEEQSAAEAAAAASVWRDPVTQVHETLASAGRILDVLDERAKEREGADLAPDEPGDGADVQLGDSTMPDMAASASWRRVAAERLTAGLESEVDTAGTPPQLDAGRQFASKKADPASSRLRQSEVLPEEAAAARFDGAVVLDGHVFARYRLDGESERYVFMPWPADARPDGDDDAEGEAGEATP